MSNIDKALRSTSERDWFEDWFKREFHPDKTGPYIKDQLFFAVRAARAPLLDELEAKDRRIEEEIARANREHHRGFMMACGHLKEHSNVHYADAAEMEIAALRNRINELESAAAGKGE